MLILAKFFRDEDGAVTVDWVVLCAAVVAFAAAMVMSMQDGASELTQDVNTFMDAQAPG